MHKPVVLVAEELSPATVEALGPDFTIRAVDGTDRAALLAAIADVDAVLIRSATRIDAEVIAAATRLRVIARAGVGLDNVDIKAATVAGVMVVNAPTSNVISAAELTIGHMLSLARHIPRATASLKAGEWRRSAFTGTEIHGKTVGIVGFGRIGQLVAARLHPFDVAIITFDPYVTAARASQLGVECVTFDDLLRRSDFITIHVPKTPETVGLIGDAAFATMKNSAVVINVARGGLIDEDALDRALRNGTIAGAGIDVFETEPSAHMPFFDCDNVIVTPHLGASTVEAQEKAGVAVARSVRLALAGEVVPDAVNVAGGIIDSSVRPAIPLAEKLGRVFSGLADGPLTSLDIEVRGELAEFDVSVLKLAALKGVFAHVVTDTVSYVNAPLVAEQRDVDVRLVVDRVSEDHRSVVTLRGSLANGRQISVAGTLTGSSGIEKIVGINGYDLEVPFASHLVVLVYEDRPGIVAVYGQKFGEADINIAGMQVARHEAGGKALTVLTIDSPASGELLESLRTAIRADVVSAIDISDS